MRRRCRARDRLRNHDVGVDGVRIKLQAWGSADRVGNDAGVSVIFGQAVDVMFECVQRAGGDDAGLRACRRRVLYGGVELGGSGRAGPHRAEPTGAPRPLEKQTLMVSKWPAQSAAEMPVATTALNKPSAVEVAGQVVVGGPAADFGDSVVGLDSARAAVVRVFQADEAGADEVIVAG